MALELRQRLQICVSSIPTLNRTLARCCMYDLHDFCANVIAECMLVVPEMIASVPEISVMLEMSASVSEISASVQADVPFHNIMIAT
ncbi:hypothetical protein Pelo_18450 [Pelomyxa schiedti]|nr:hypothetical protein Pelo_18450 [Pelomyxa schiedti]